MQVLSETVSCGLVSIGGRAAVETAKFVSLMDKFFDILNVTNFTDGTKTRKRFKHPFRHKDDFRLAVSTFVKPCAWIDP